MSGQIHFPATLPLEIESSVDMSLEAEGTDKWRAVVSTVMSRGVARSAENFLTAEELSVSEQLCSMEIGQDRHTQTDRQ